MEKLNIVFMGTAELARASLAALAKDNSLNILSVVSQPDKPSGRKLKLQPTPVKALAEELGLPVLQPERARDPEFIQQLQDLAPDLIVVAAYGQILKKAIINLPRLGCINVHTSLLPKYRGASPIQSAILNGDRETGVTIMMVERKLDAGDILSVKRTPIHEDETGQTLHDRLAEMGGQLLVATIHRLAKGEITPLPQDESKTTYAHKIAKQDGLLDWRQSALSLRNRIRAFNPWPGAFTHLGGASKPKLLKIWQAEFSEANDGQPGTILHANKDGIIVKCGEQALRIVSLQKEGSRRMNAQDFLAGHPLKSGDSIASPLIKS